MLHFISLFFSFLSSDPSSQPSSETTGKPHYGTHMRSSPVVTLQDAAISWHPPQLSLRALPEEAVPPLSISQSDGGVPFTIRLLHWPSPLPQSWKYPFSLLVWNTHSFPRSWFLLSVIQATFQHFDFASHLKNLSSFLKFRRQLKRWKQDPTV